MAANKNLLVLGHRGVILDRPPYQNSLRAFEEAIDACDGIETDACVDRDGEVFLMHEAKYADEAKGVEYCAAEHLDAASAALMGDRRIDEMTTAEMRRLRLRDGSPVPTLKETIRLFKGKPDKLLNIELKAYNAVGPVLHDVGQALRNGSLLPEALLISSFNHSALEVVRREMPEIAVGAIFIGNDQRPAGIFPWQPGSAGLYTGLTAAALEDPLLRTIRPEYIIMPEDMLTKNTVDLVAAHHPQAKLAAWVFAERGEFDLAAFMERFEELAPARKVGAMIVDNPREFVKALPR